MEHRQSLDAFNKYAELKGKYMKENAALSELQAARGKGHTNCDTISCCCPRHLQLD